MSRFPISACSANYGKADLFRILDRLCELGYDGVEITVMYHAVPDETSPERRREILGRARDAGLTVSGLHFIFPAGLKMMSPDPEERRRVADHIRSVLELGHDLEAPLVVIGGGGLRTVPAGMSRETGVAHVVDVFTQVARHAEATGVTACFEALNRFETTIGRSFAETCAYIDGIGSPALKLAGDTFHMNIEESSLPGAIEAAGVRLAHLHLPDSNRLAPGTGHIDFRPILGALGRIGYRGFLSFEIFWIAPDIPYLPSWEECDAQSVQAIRHVREVETMLRDEARV
jgi:sugar phosphate isomerase/epimerase